MLRGPTIIILVLTLAACAGSTDFASTPVEPVKELARPDAQPPENLSKDCRSPILLPERDISAGEVERLWGEDRVSLTLCGRKHRGLRNFYRLRDRKLSGE